MRLVEYLSPDGQSPFAVWFRALSPQAASKVVVVLGRIERGNLASIKSVGGGVMEARIDWGPGYRVYVGRDGEELVILLAGGIKHRQQNDIAAAHARWQDYKSRKRR